MSSSRRRLKKITLSYKVRRVFALRRVITHLLLLDVGRTSHFPASSGWIKARHNIQERAHNKIPALLYHCADSRQLSKDRENRYLTTTTRTTTGDWRETGCFEKKKKTGEKCKDVKKNKNKWQKWQRGMIVRGTLLAVKTAPRCSRSTKTRITRCTLWMLWTSDAQPQTRWDRFTASAWIRDVILFIYVFFFSWRGHIAEIQ